MNTNSRTQPRGIDAALARIVYRLWLAAVLAIAVPGCAVFSFKDSLPQAILNQEDPDIVRDGAPAFLITLDALVESDPEDAEFLLVAARLYSSYAGAFLTHNPERSLRLTDRAWRYAQRAMCLESDEICSALELRADEFSVVLNEEIDDLDLELLQGFGEVWAGWLQMRSDDWVALTHLPKIEAVFESIIATDDSYQDGAPHLYLGVLKSQVPPSLGGDPERARQHFEIAIDLSSEKNLIAKTLLAQHYARLVYDRELHDTLLQEVLESEADVPGLTLSNVLAQEQASLLLSESDEFFE